MASNQQKYLDPKVVSSLKNIEIKARLIVEGFITGLHQSPYYGFSVEFAEHRPYNTGEPLKNIDWKVYAKTDKLFVKKYEEETNLRAYIVLDTSDSMHYPVNQPVNKLEYGSYLAAALGYLMVQQRDAVGLTLFDEALRTYIPPKAKYSWLVNIFKKLEEVSQTTEYFQHRTATPEILHKVAHKVGRRGLIVLITDLFTNLSDPDELFPALQHLRHLNHEVLVFQLLDRSTEEAFEFANQPLILQDLETKEEIRVQPNQVKEEYVRHMQAFKEKFKRRCREYNIDFVEVDINTSYDKVLKDYLIKRRTLYK